MRRTLFGIALVLHGLAHADAGLLASNGYRLLPTLLWAAASVAFLGAGFGLIGVRRLERHWQSLGLLGVFASLALLVVWRPATAALGIAVDLAILGILGFVSMPRRQHRHRDPTRLERFGQALTLAGLVYVAVAIVSRPFHARWGSTDAELRAALPADDLVPDPHYRIQHAVTIHAAPADIWPWLVQLGQGRGGFYSYDWLERALGDDVHNADRIHPEWQTLREGDLVRAVQPDYLRGRFGPDVGWRVARIEPGRFLTLGGWGSFVLQPQGNATRLIVRTRGARNPNVPLAPLGVLVFEPAHFIMERGMLLGIKARAERWIERPETLGL
jgi:hypothetical protein